eukprot:893051-Prorocentrum_minimum.AAC.1
MRAVFRPCRPPPNCPDVLRLGARRQSVYELSDGSGVVVTVGKYVTPGRNFIDQAGISPDFNQFPGFDLAEDATR